jgi:hypothetical protein
MDRDRIKRRVATAIDAHAAEMVEVARYLLANPEIGFGEAKAAAIGADMRFDRHR